MNTSELEGWDRQLRTLTNGQAIAVAFVATPPEGVARHHGASPYTGLADDQGYVAIAGAALAGTMERLATIVTANETLEGFHRQRKAVAHGT